MLAMLPYYAEKGSATEYAADKVSHALERITEGASTNSISRGKKA